MASGSKQKTTMAKLNRERALRERRELKAAKKEARKLAAANPSEDQTADDELELVPAQPADDGDDGAGDVAGPRRG